MFAIPVIFFLFPLIKKATRWILVVGVTVGIQKSNINGGISMTFPWSPNYDITPSILFYSPLTYLFIRLCAALVDNSFATDTFFNTGTFQKVWARNTIKLNNMILKHIISEIREPHHGVHIIFTCYHSMCDPYHGVRNCAIIIIPCACLEWRYSMDIPWVASMQKMK